MFNKTETLIPPCWILTNPRSGSNFLCSLLANTKLFEEKSFDPIFSEKFVEFFNINKNKSPLFSSPMPIGEKSIKNRIKKSKNTLKAEISSGKFTLNKYSKVHRYKYTELHKFTDKDRHIIEKKLPGIKYIHLIRKDIVSRVISDYFLIMSGVHHIVENTAENTFTFQQSIEVRNVILPFESCQKDLYQYTKIPFIKDLVLYYYNVQKKYQNEWYKYLDNIDYFEVEFDDLINSPEKVLKNILSWMNINQQNLDIKNIVKKSKTILTKKQESNFYVEKLKSILNGNHICFHNKLKYIMFLGSIDFFSSCKSHKIKSLTRSIIKYYGDNIFILRTKITQKFFYDESYRKEIFTSIIENHDCILFISEDILEFIMANYNMEPIHSCLNKLCGKIFCISTSDNANEFHNNIKNININILKKLNLNFFFTNDVQYDNEWIMSKSFFGLGYTAIDFLNPSNKLDFEKKYNSIIIPNKKIYYNSWAKNIDYEKIKNKIKQLKMNNEFNIIENINIENASPKDIYKSNITQINRRKFSLCPFETGIGSSRIVQSFAVGSLVISQYLDDTKTLGYFKDGYNYLSIGKKEKDLNNILEIILDNKNHLMLKKIANNGFSTYNKYFALDNINKALPKYSCDVLLNEFSKRSNNFFANILSETDC